MKRLLCTLLTLAMLLTGVLALCSCNNADGGKKEAVIPEGCTKFDNGDISFAYPDSWKKNEGSITQLINESGVGNNITVVYEAKTDLYEKSSEDELKQLMTQGMASVGMSVSNFKVTKTQNDFTPQIIKISMNTTAGSVSMTQTQFVVTVGERTYTVTVSETSADQQLVDNVFNTLTALK